MIRRRIFHAVSTFLTEEDGPTAVEYAVMLALIFLAVVGSVGLLGGVTNDAFQDAFDRLSAN